MRSFTPKTFRAATLTALVIIVPFAGAYAESAVFGPRLTALIDPQDVIALAAVLISSLIVAGLIRRVRAEHGMQMLASERLRDARAQLAHLDRLASLDQLTASIVHEVTQPIAATLTNAQAAMRWLDRREPDLVEVRQSLDRIIKEGHHAREVIDRIRAFIKKAPPRKDRLEINGAIREVIEFTRGEAAKNGVLMKTNLADALPLIEGDRVQLQQVILNLIINAAEAMSCIGEGPRELLISSGKADSNSVRVAVQDSGPGLAPAALEQVFEAFYTTKPSGLGVGLAICRSIIEAHGGRLWASANVPRGATFQFTVPAHPDSSSITGGEIKRLEKAIMYAITGITGKVGSELARTLLASGQPVRAVVRDARKGEEWAALGCEIAVAEMENAPALTDAFTGATAVFILPPSEFDPEPGYPEARAVIDSLVQALTTAKPGKVLCLSTIGADAVHDNLLSQRTLMEAALSELPLPLTILRPAWFIDNAAWDVASARDTGLIHSFLQPTDKAFPMVAAKDVGRVAAELIQEDWTGIRVVELAGPARVSPNDLADAFARAIGKPMRAVPVPREFWEGLFRSQGMRNPEPRMRMLDGFNEGWIEFEEGGRRAIKGRTNAIAVISALVAAAEENLEAG